ncbi:MAG: hypothetical protein P8L85_17035 [Rubripirellula sp.]|nr:hypothetical protein [Rubripirellula sp.]
MKPLRCLLLIVAMIGSLFSCESLSAEESLFARWHGRLSSCSQFAETSGCDEMLSQECRCGDSDCDNLGSDFLGCDGSACDAMNGSQAGCGCLQWSDGGSCLDRCLPRTDICLPLFGDKIADRGITLPLPVGFGVVSTFLKRHVAVSDVRVGIGGNTQQSLQRFQVDNFDVNADNQIARADLWILPCLNVYGIAGRTHSRGSVLINVSEFPLVSSPDLQIPLSFELNGFTYGGGATAAIGTADYFASVDINYSHTDFNSLDNELFALVISPRFGAIIDRDCFKGEVHIGAMYQDTQQTVEVVLDQPILGTIAVEVDQYEPDPWNFLVGGLWGIDERLHLMVEFGVGGREYVISGLTARF